MLITETVYYFLINLNQITKSLKRDHSRSKVRRQSNFPKSCFFLNTLENILRK